MGELIKKARDEAGISQEELAEKIYRKRLAVSQMENGKVEISALTVSYLARALDKPISYFYPENLKRHIDQENLTNLEEELIINFRKIWYEHLQKLAIELIKVISNFDPQQMLVGLIDITKEDYEIEKELKAIVNAKKGGDKNK